MRKTVERKTAEIRVLLEPSLKKKSRKILDKIGISESEAVRIFFRNLVNRKEFPIELRIPPVSEAEQKDIESILDERTGADKKISRSETHTIDL
ncbi:MAG: type II toxin-antitoxin system RelB/DinJ family antitoxin [Melioribacteraceae bacterium]|nr:type II toxin-antitoxin system RelB/DinJ family antitoxin [Melioribacteraceae bacterium]MCF8353070.1 type II toxin-antitoxin system RelB/DinJ family antitoxin [Melioribacteraceae bacterium]MCF8392784.1 type II toxin-antitoxin system RelB/DinJ family antitoxin [Melioribacteraceae bacterium]MCF8418315.1 type II toxin-antitoxin system RelB/DinJ family antitoxin [Melioribacteraceae bacterium]